MDPAMFLLSLSMKLTKTSEIACRSMAVPVWNAIYIYRWSIYARSMRINSKTYILLHACIVVASCHQDRIIHQLADAYQEIKNN